MGRNPEAQKVTHPTLTVPMPRPSEVVERTRDGVRGCGVVPAAAPDSSRQSETFFINMSCNKSPASGLNSRSTWMLRTCLGWIRSPRARWWYMYGGGAGQGVPKTEGRRVRKSESEREILRDGERARRKKKERS